LRAAPDRAATVGPLFVAINRAGIPHELIESELLGYKDGAFAGAGRGGQVGKVELADRGTPCLDEIRQMPLGPSSGASSRMVTRLGTPNRIREIGLSRQVRLN